MPVQYLPPIPGVRSWHNLLPAKGERAGFFGMTGSGKSHLVRELLRLGHLEGMRPNVCVLDGKGTVNWRGYKLVKSLAKLRELDPDRDENRLLIYRPPATELKQRCEPFFEWIYERKKTCVPIDEIYSIANGNKIGDAALACLTRGRELGIEIWGCSQRPMRIPQEYLTEAENIYAFRLQAPQDRKKLSAVAGTIPADALATLQDKYFFYTRPEYTRARGPLTLKESR